MLLWTYVYFFWGRTLDKFEINVNFKTPFGCVFLMFTLSRSIMTCVGYQSPVTPRKHVESSAVPNFGGVTDWYQSQGYRELGK